jgi:signal transduction histidine kinase
LRDIALTTLAHVTAFARGAPLAEVRDRIFEALFTTKAKGSGLGLALCQRIVEGHGGTIALEISERGAAFKIAVPDVPG